MSRSGLICGIRLKEEVSIRLHQISSTELIHVFLPHIEVKIHCKENGCICALSLAGSRCVVAISLK